MRPHQARFVTACQQLLALGVVLAVLTPAAAVVSLDVIGLPGTSQSAPPAGTAPTLDRDRPADDRAAGDDDAAPAEEAAPAPRASVPVGSVEPTVTEVPLTAATTAPAPRARARGAEDATEPEGGEQPAPEPTEPAAPTETAEPAESTGATGPVATTVVSKPQPVEGYGAVGVTWSHEDQVADDAITIEVRTLQDGAWSGWTDVEYHEEHAPDPASAEGGAARPGTDPLLVGEVDEVQARAVAPEGLPADMSLAVVEPGTADEQRSEAPELSMGEGPATTQSDGEPGSDSEGAIELQASISAPRPTIFSRSQWGADERMRDGSPSYGSISAGFVHHTVNANDYTRAQVPGIIRGIYAYHTRSRGWSDIGYNFLVDKFGRIWEGRYGGVARPVIGAHTLGYNHASFAMSAIGNFDTARPPQAMLEAYGDLFGWKLGLHDVAADDMRQNVAGDYFPAINGHRDAGSTACPGRYLYARLDAIRDLAKQAQTAPEEPKEPEPEPEPEPLVPQQLDSDLTGTPHPDLVVRRASDGRGLVVPTGGHTRFRAPAQVASGRWDRRAPVATPDLTRDGLTDLLTIDGTGALEVRPGRADGRFAAPVRVVRSFRGHDLLAAVGDVTGDGRADVVGRRRGGLVVFKQGRRGRYRLVESGVGVRGVLQLSGAGDVTGDERRDLWGLDSNGQLLLFRGLGSGRFASRTVMPGDWSGVDQVAGGVDYTLDGIADLVARRGDGSLVVRPGRGDGTLGPALGPTANGGALRMISGAGQVSGSSAPDLLAVDADGALVTLTNRGTFDLGRPIDTGRTFGRANLLLNAGDFDGDGHGDVILRKPRGPLLLFRGTGTGRLKEPVKIGRRGFRAVTGLRTVADLTGDRAPDLLGVQDGTTYVWTGRGAAMLGEATAVTVAQDPAARVKGSYDWIIRASDLTLKGAPDLVVRERETGHLYRINGTSKSLRAPRYIGEGTGWNLGG